MPADIAAEPKPLKLVGYVQAGARHDGVVGAGEAVRIFTGAPVPEGAIPSSPGRYRRRGRHGSNPRNAAVGTAYPRRGQSTTIEGQIGLTAGTRLGARDLGLAAGMNRPWLMVHRRPRVAILPTGDEVALPGDPIGPNQIVSSNGTALAALVAGAGGVPIQLGIGRDDSDRAATPRRRRVRCRSAGDHRRRFGRRA
ncbi:MAG: hypothetical protein WDN69_33275 [Aliidongia sp.]